MATAATAGSTADHSKFKDLEKHFQSGPEITKACLFCHTEPAKQVQKTERWTWEYRQLQFSIRRESGSIFCIFFVRDLATR